MAKQFPRMSGYQAIHDVAILVEAMQQAQTALQKYPSCFWTRRLGAPLETTDDLRLVIRRLRQNGNRAAAAAALRIEACL